MRQGIGFDQILRNLGDFVGGGSPSLVEGDASNAGDFGGGERGYRSVRTREQQSAEWRRARERDFMEAARLVRKAFDGDRYAQLLMQDALRGRFREALSTSDFPTLFGDIIDRSVLANYQETGYTWNLIAREHMVSDFRTVRVMRIDGGSGLLGDKDSSSNIIPIEQGAQYGEDKLVDAGYTYKLAKYGKRMPFFWETMINDDLDAIKDTPARFGRGARRSEEWFVTKLFANNTSFYTTANKNVVKSSVLAAAPSTSFTNPPLSIDGLQNGMLVLSSQIDQDGLPIDIDAITLVVGPALEVTANNIVHARELWANTFGGTVSGSASAQRLITENWMKNRVKVAVNKMLPLVDATYGGTGWYLFASPANGRPALEFGKLKGHATPELFMKLPNSVAIGESAMGPGTGPSVGTMNSNPMEGDFDSDSIHYKIRHVFGGTQLDPIVTVYSNGSNA